MIKLLDEQLAQWRDAKVTVHAFSDRSTRLSGRIGKFDDETIEIIDGDDVTLMQRSKCMNITTKQQKEREGDLWIPLETCWNA